MLSRLAESLYWIGRYMERAENTARLLTVNYYATLETGGQVSEEWRPLLDISGGKDTFAQRYGRVDATTVPTWLAFDRTNPSSVSSSLARARENARGLRDRIPSEMWECLNRAYHDLCFQDEEVLARDGLFEFCSAARDTSQFFFGIAFATLPRDEGWLFMRAGQMLERGDNVLRLLQVRYRHRAVDPALMAVNNHRWMAVLKTASAYEAYRKCNHASVTPRTIAEFLLLNAAFPRSVRYSSENLYDALAGIDRIHPGAHPELLREARWLLARLEHATVDELMDRDQQDLGTLLNDFNQIGSKISASYFTV
ncbi:alpha-E domain-containing protein (plasmid) [Deinococcus taeanensis]|uniref:alpha-E domain-containing protein n=1 Tax=Deinococcus taeanensis TaxID=2737050 RepID=UPI001CDD5992|nr:alpha-E domain-containing protein [Deinococcus taeanensis]UBV45215.1 alpha-E domain-containing protein [Deinococcus taeanensis]